MGNFVFQDLNRFGQVWREGDPPLVNGADPIVEPETEAGHPGRERLLLALGVIACVILGARLVELLLTQILNDLRLAGAPLAYHPSWIAILVGAWVCICLLAIVRAWRKSR